MKALSVSEFLKFRDVPSCSRRGLIIRTLFRARGYTYGHYQTEFNGDVFCLFHYRTCILRVDLSKKQIIDYDGWSNSDRQMLHCALWRLGLHDYDITLNSNEPPMGLVIWYQNAPMRKEGAGPYTLADLKPDEVDWLKRKKKDVLLRKAVEGRTWHRWAYTILYGQSKPNQKRLTNEPSIEAVPFQRARRSGGGRGRWDYDQTRLTKWSGRGRAI